MYTHFVPLLLVLVCAGFVLQKKSFITIVPWFDVILGFCKVTISIMFVNFEFLLKMCV